MRVHQSEYTPANTSTGNSSEQRQVHQCETKAPSEHTGISAETAVHQALVYRANIRNRELVSRHGVLDRKLHGIDIGDDLPRGLFSLFRRCRSEPRREPVARAPN